MNFSHTLFIFYMFMCSFLEIVTFSIILCSLFKLLTFFVMPDIDIEKLHIRPSDGITNFKRPSDEITRMVFAMSL